MFWFGREQGMLVPDEGSSWYGEVDDFYMSL